MTKPDEIAAIVAKIGRAQKRVLLALPDDGEWGPSCDHAAAKRLWIRDDIPMLIDHRHRTNDCWSLRPIGLAVRAHLEGSNND